MKWSHYFKKISIHITQFVSLKKIYKYDHVTFNLLQMIPNAEVEPSEGDNFDLGLYQFFWLTLEVQ